MKEETLGDTMIESRLYAALTKAGLCGWIPVVATLALRFQGLEEVTEPGDAPPLHQLARLARDAASFTPAWRERLLFHRLARLPLFCWQAANPSGKWDPLHESLQEFMAKGETALWQEETPNPQPGTVEHWLRHQLRKDIK